MNELVISAQSRDVDIILGETGFRLLKTGFKPVSQPS